MLPDGSRGLVRTPWSAPASVFQRTLTDSDEPSVPLAPKSTSFRKRRVSINLPEAIKKTGDLSSSDSESEYPMQPRTAGPFCSSAPRQPTSILGTMCGSDDFGVKHRSHQRDLTSLEPAAMSPSAPSRSSQFLAAALPAQHTAACASGRAGACDACDAFTDMWNDALDTNLGQPVKRHSMLMPELKVLRDACLAVDDSLKTLHLLEYAVINAAISRRTSQELLLLYQEAVAEARTSSRVRSQLINLMPPERKEALRFEIAQRDASIQYDMLQAKQQQVASIARAESKLLGTSLPDQTSASGDDKADERGHASSFHYASSSHYAADEGSTSVSGYSSADRAAPLSSSGRESIEVA